MKKIRFLFIAVIIAFCFSSGHYALAQNKVNIKTPMTPPEWAMLERQLLEANSSAIAEFYNHFFDERGFYLHVARWGALDGTDDVPETAKYWTILHALGASENVLELYKKVLEGAYRLYSTVKTTSTDVAKYGSYYKDFMPMSDFMHQGESHQGLMFQGLSDPDNILMRNRYKRFAGFYLNEDPDVLNYDTIHKIIRSFWTGSRGPMLREGSAYDWSGDLTYGKYHMLHHSGGSRIMMDYAKEYQGIVDHFYFFPQSTAGDHPLNMAAIQLAFNAYLLDHEKKYRDWIIEYADAWKERAAANNGNFPTNVGLDGKTGTAVADKWYFDKRSAKNKWYMGTYGWNFSFYYWTHNINHENHVLWGTWCGMGDAYMLTGDPGYIGALRKQIDNFYANKKTINGVEMIPKNYGIHIDRDQPRKFNVFDVKDEKLFVPDGMGFEGWYNWTPDLFESELIDLYLWSMDRKDLERIPKNSLTGWISFLEGNNPGYPVEALRKDLAFVNTRIRSMQNDPTTPDTRLADWADDVYNPATANELVRLMLGGNLTGRTFSLHTRVRYFDPEKYRAGLPEDVASLVTKLDGGITNVTLVNINQVKSRRVIIQTGAYGEHQCLSVKIGEKEYPVNARYFEVNLDPGAGAELTISVKRYANQPTFSFPW
jgi:hypothetical protein